MLVVFLRSLINRVTRLIESADQRHTLSNEAGTEDVRMRAGRKEKIISRVNGFLFELLHLIAMRVNTVYCNPLSVFLQKALHLVTVRILGE